MDALQVPKKNAEKVKDFLLQKMNLDFQHKIVAKQKYVYFPLLDKKEIPRGYAVVSLLLPTKAFKETSLKEKLAEFLTPIEMKKLKTAFDQIGTIAILEIDPELEKKEKKIGKALLELFPSLKTVLKKAGSHEGVFRTQKMRLLAGVDTRETIHRENGVALHLDVERVYFSPRLGNERKRIVQQVRKGESILVMFSGVGVYPCVLAKNTAAKELYGVELNPVGHQYGLKNVAVNKLKNVFLYEGDVRAVVPKLQKKFDRILMPLPKSSEEFLDVAFIAAKMGCIIHCYDFLHEDHFQDAVEKIKKACKIAKKKCKVLRIVKCGQHSPRVFRICVDFIVE